MSCVVTIVLILITHGHIDLHVMSLWWYLLLTGFWCNCAFFIAMSCHNTLMNVLSDNLLVKAKTTKVMLGVTFGNEGSAIIHFIFMVRYK